jgi:hypothetical protein
MPWAIILLVIGVILLVIAVNFGTRAEWYGDVENWLVPIIGAIGVGILALAALVPGIILLLKALKK